MSFVRDSIFLSGTNIFGLQQLLYCKTAPRWGTTNCEKKSVAPTLYCENNNAEQLRARNEKERTMKKEERTREN
jgi:hypothetical protein